MQRFFTGLLICVTTLMLASCAKKEPEVTVPPAETKTADADAAPTTTTETVVVVEEQPDATTPPAPPAPLAKAEPEIKTVARPSLLLELMLEPIQFAALSTVQSLQGLAKPLVSGNIPGLPGAGEQGSAEPKSEEAKETPTEPAADEPASEAANAPPASDPQPE